MRAPSAPTLRELRGERTLQKVAVATGYTIGHLSNVERGQAQAGRKLRAALARFYKLTETDVARSCARTQRRAAAA